MIFFSRNYQTPFLWALILHLIILAFFIFQLSLPLRAPGSISSQTTIVHAVAISQSVLTQYQQAQQQAQQIKAAQQALLKQQQLQAQQRQIQLAQEKQQQLQRQQQAFLQAQKAVQQKIQAQQLHAIQQAKQLVADQQKIAREKALQAHEAAIAHAKEEMAVKAKMAKEKAQAAQALKMVEIKKAEAIEKAAVAEKAARAAVLKKNLEKQLLQNIQSQVADGTTKTDATALSQSQGLIDKYKTMIIQAISEQWVVPPNLPQNISCELNIRLAPGGVVLQVAVSKSSGNPALDNSAMAAVHKASPLPVPQDSTLFSEFRELHLTVKPDGSMSSSE